MKNLALFKLVVWGIVALFCLGILLNAILHDGIPFRLFSGTLTRSIKEYEIVGDYNVSGSDIKEVDIDWKSGSLRLLRSENSDIRILESAPKNIDKSMQLKYETKNGSLIIKQGDIRGFRLPFFLSNISTHADVYLPEKLYDKINAECTSGQIEAEKISSKVFNADTESGSIVISDIKSESSTLSATSGKIEGVKAEIGEVRVQTSSGKIELSGSFKDIWAHCTSGNIRLETAVSPDSIKADVTSGVLYLTLPENDGFTLDYKITSGSFESDFELNNMQPGKKEGAAVYKNGTAKYDLSVVSGKIELNRR